MEYSDDSREPPLKKARKSDSSTSESVCNDLQESEEDTIPFADEDYERITEKSKMLRLKSVFYSFIDKISFLFKISS